MEYMKFDDAYVVRLDRGEEIVESLTKDLRQGKDHTGNDRGVSVRRPCGDRSCNREQVYHKTELNGPMEITALTGMFPRWMENLSSYSRDLCDEKMNVKGGHLNECRISATAEITIRTVNGKVERFYDKDGVGLNLYQFPGNEGYKNC